MNQVYFKNSSGKYHYGQYFEEAGEAVRFALEFRNVSPSIMVTNENDYSIFEIEKGEVTFPEDEGDFSDIPRIGLCEHLPASSNEYMDLIEKRNNTPHEDQSFMVIESILLASAARDGINLNSYGWSLP